MASDVLTFDLFCQPFWSFLRFFLKWETWQSLLLGCLSIVFIGYYVISPSLLTSFSMVTLLLVWVDFGLNWIKKKGTTTESLSRDERLRVIYSDYVYVITFIDSLKVKFQINTPVLSWTPLRSTSGQKNLEPLKNSEFNRKVSRRKRVCLYWRNNISADSYCLYWEEFIKCSIILGKDRSDNFPFVPTFMVPHISF